MNRSCLSLLLSSLFLAALAIGCTTGPDETGNPDRGPLGKADALGSCEATSCDGPAPSGNCWCDELCSYYGDCCSDKVDVCDAPVLEACGGHTIGPPPTCDESSYCHYEQSDTCGWADAQGVCMDTPEACTEIVMPVCGCDGVTYSNSCFANMAGTSVVNDGACDAPAPSYCLAESACDEESFCDMSECNMPPCPPGMACPQVCYGLCSPNVEGTPSLQIGNATGPIAPNALVNSLSLAADVLTISVTYSGGCQQHDFALFWTGTFLESFPVQAALVLTHEANGDLCKALISEELTFDLSVLKAAYLASYDEDGGTVKLRVGSLSIPYTFTAGSCQSESGADNFCGGQGSAGCWCDAACDGYGDCCSDKSVTCDLE